MMSPTRSFLFYLLAAMFTYGCTSQTVADQPEQPDYAMLEREVQEMLMQSIEMFKNKDLDGLVNRFTDEGTLKITGRPIVAGKSALRQHYEGVLQLPEFNMDLSITKTHIAKAGDMAYILADYTASFVTPGGPFSDAGITLVVFVRHNDSWKMAAENLSSNPAAIID